MLRNLLFAVLFFPFLAVHSLASEAAFFKNIQGKWSGPGEIVAGKYKGTKFTCVFDGLSPSEKTAMNVDGYCRVGMFSQPMNASVTKGNKGFFGKFLDGEAGEGMNITGGRYSKNKFVADIKRKDLRGAMVARKMNDNRLQVTISVRVDGKLIPVIGMALDRVGGKAAKVAQN